jgi:hypothetical protein
MQTVPDKKFTFTVDRARVPIFTAIPQGDYWRVVWSTLDEENKEVQYPHAMVQKFVASQGWRIQQVIRRTVDSLKEAEGYKLGDKVTVKDKWLTYRSLGLWAEAHDLKNWQMDKTPQNGDVLTIVEIGRQLDAYITHALFGLQAADGRTFIMNALGFTKADALQAEAELKRLTDLRSELASINKQIDALATRAKNIRTQLTGE